MAQVKEEVIISVSIDKKRAEKQSAELTAQISKLTEQRKVLRKQLKELQKDEQGNADAIKKVSAELVTNQTELKKSQKEQRILQRELSANENSLDGNRAALSRLKAEYGKFRVGIDGTESDLNELKATIANLNTEISEQEQEIGVFSRNVGNYAGGIRDALGGSIPGAAIFAAGTAGIAALGGALVSAGQAAIEFGSEVNEARTQVEQLTGLQGDALTNLTAQIVATAKNYDTDFNEVLLRTNTLSKQMGISQAEALEKIQSGLAQGANVSGEFLDIIGEYPAQFRDMGASADEFLNLATAQIKAGIFSDKGIDAIKTAGEELGAMTPKAREALQSLGIDESQIEGLTLFEISKLAADEITKLPPQSAIARKAVEGIFGSAGLDAGLQFFDVLKDVSSQSVTLSDIAANLTGEYSAQEQAQAELTLQTEEFARISQATLGETGAAMTKLKAVGLGLANSLIKGLISISNYFIDLYNESTGFRVSLQAMGAVGKTALRLVSESFTSLINNAKAFGAVLKAAVTLNFKAIPGIVSDAFSQAKQQSQDLGQDLGKTWSDAFNAGFSPKEKVELITLGDNETAEIQKAYEGLGKMSAESLAKGFNENLNQLDSIEANAEVNAEKVNKILAETAATESLLESEKQLAQERLNQIGLTPPLLNAYGQLIDAKAGETKVTNEAATETGQNAQSNQELNNSYREQFGLIQQRAQVVAQALGEETRAGKAALAVQKTSAIASVTMDLKESISSLLKAGLKSFAAGPLGIIQGIASIALIGTQVARFTGLLNDLRSLDSGGFTGIKGMPDMKLPGRTITGYVHDNEYVVPTEVLETPQGQQLTGQLEAIRTGQLKSYNIGGFTGSFANSFTQPITSQVINQVEMGGLSNKLDQVVSAISQLNVVATIEDINAGINNANKIQLKANQ